MGSLVSAGNEACWRNKMDFEILRWPAICIFASALSFEALITSKLHVSRGKLDVSNAFSWYMTLALACMSITNGYVLIEVYNRDALGSAIISKMLLSLFSLGIVLGWNHYLGTRIAKFDARKAGVEKP
jgi:hypothetical protein